MKESSQNYFLGTLIKTPLKVYFAGSTAHVAIKEFVFLLSIVITPPDLQNSEILSKMLKDAVLIYVPAHSPGTVLLNVLFGVGVLAVWTLKYDRATDF